MPYLWVEIRVSNSAGTVQENISALSLFVDEVHRFSESQQDALLPWVENGTVILIGATTENPYLKSTKGCQPFALPATPTK